ncbi:hypothetical protein G647_10409 [Cladophialophora carrionii CBS 160.54]|uniref:DUF7908 domain-containing protein n=1 Tax=Cladophialophora carrionii CBS 160.54 TaxID=1279043 RepID=V9DK03_9EURO|nr:uncharacterized protein G647_10409 [Cladophialophora carrionii CBS 160.54]ETI26648.1 hypothetical protein G647_10409 [Cladophialophora carrionii CBS 160.54]
MWKVLTSAAVALQLVTPVVGYGTTISIGVSYCPAGYPSSSTTSSTATSASTTPRYDLFCKRSDETDTQYSITPGEPVILAFTTNGNAEYLRADGTITNDSSQAADFSVNIFGQLMAGDGYVSTSGDVAFQLFAVSADTPGMKTASRIFTQFLINLDGTLAWINDAFVGGRVIFCVSGSTMVVAFNGAAPPGCAVIQLGVIFAVDVTPPAASSTTSLPQSTSGNMPSMSSNLSPPNSSGFPTTTVSPPGTTITVSTTPSIPELSSPTPESSTPQAPPSSVTSCLPYAGPSSSSDAPSTSASGTAYPAPTTTGTPNCYDRSPFDGTVNDNYLILCDTDLPGYDLDAVPASDMAECVDACRSYVPTSQAQCVAIEFDILESGNPCHLKYSIPTAKSKRSSIIHHSWSPSSGVYSVHNPKRRNLSFHLDCTGAQQPDYWHDYFPGFTEYATEYPVQQWRRPAKQSASYGVDNSGIA